MTCMGLEIRYGNAGAITSAYSSDTLFKGCSFLMARLRELFHAGTGVLLKLVLAPLLTHDLAQVPQVHPM